MEVTGESPVILLANKADLMDKALFGEKEMGEVSKKLNAPFLLTSAKDGRNVGEAFEQSKMINKIDRWGYVRSDHCRGDGTYSVRGGIVDVFPKQFAHPVRIEFFNNTVESIRLFDVDTQLSVSSRKRINIQKPIRFIASDAGKNIGDLIMKSGHLLYITLGREVESGEYDFASVSDQHLNLPTRA